ncbi:MAG: efflux RND transporter periplasmic adaptor subunit [Steroidobacteraceae bacterium]
MSMFPSRQYAGALSLLLTLGGSMLPAHGHAEEVLVKLTATQLKTAGITVADAQAPDKNDAPATGNTLRLTGRVAIPNRSIELISASVAGRVQAVLVNVGETVRNGTPLARLYSPELLSLQREYLHARSAAQLSSQKLQRDESLFQDGIIAHSRLEETRNGNAQAQASLQEQRQLLKLAGLNETAINKLNSGSDINPVLTINAGMNGVVLEQSATPGARVEPGTALFQVGNTRTLWVELQATQGQVKQLAIGNSVSAPGCPQPGRLIAISPQVSRDSQTALVRAEFADAGNCLRPNQYVEVDIGTRGGNAVVSIPGSALLRSGGKDYVFVQTPNGFRLQEVSIQTRQADRVWVSNTLAAGTEVAVTGVTALRGAASGLGSEE